ncbi:MULTISPECIES: EscU/YscU/HrcU family type III secretion system export apparatus switch protein [Gammaproteobacteria]|uniref:EscU/YscU/HrcU family type III secretion system export apparatus switch protein n=1 Tax=Gammaproteobacteria TaxID=1236 RepID=UPI000DD08FAD|nr:MULTISPECIES: EscU/YscU/HrcU family type III secretion system export apparatus switch protein [Gammaproteobacteria]RTE86119.1 flagellar biosynthesis protein FlhB [Aliidiomarina sp. B3213]TCZ91472.1 flagellar biosynthesis protein FlhB [Lysobacter sp. N42]
MSGSKKEKKAVGLKYDGVSAPTVVARGFDGLADEIIELAKEAGVLVHEDPELADFLAKLEVGDEIPQEVYVIIAELIAFATWLNLKA